MTSIHCLSTSNQFDENENEDHDSKNNLDSFANSTLNSKILLKTFPNMGYKQEKSSGSSFSPSSPNDENKGENYINSPQPSIIEQRKPQITFSEDVKNISQSNIQPIENKSTEVEEEEEEDDDDFPAPRQKSNTFTAGYISTHIPCEQKKSQFGLRLNLNIRNPYNTEDSDIMDPEVDSSHDYDSTDDSFTLTTINPRSEFAKRRSSFFKTFKPESLRLITPMKNDTNDQKPPAIMKKENFDEKFEMQEKLGEGCHSVVRRCQKKEDSPMTSFAVKIISYKDPEYLFEILQEERVLSLLNHKNIIKYDSFFLEKDKKKAYIVSEYALGKTLGYYVQNKRNFCTREIRSIAKQTLKAIAHMHSKGIIHRDLSYNNIMYDPQSEQVKVIDFTVSKILTIQKLLTNTGTLNFKAPEMLSGQFYSHSIDIFSLGVNLFSLLFGYLPFNDDSDKQVIQNIINKNPLEFYKNQPNHDPLLLHFLEQILEKNPLKRLTALQALKHPWINQKITSDDLKKSYKLKKTLKNGISASTVAELDDIDQEQDTFASFNQFMVKTLINLQDD